MVQATNFPYHERPLPTTTRRLSQREVKGDKKLLLSVLALYLYCEYWHCVGTFKSGEALLSRALAWFKSGEALLSTALKRVLSTALKRVLSTEAQAQAQP